MDFKVKSLGYTTFGVIAMGAVKELKIEKDKEIEQLKSTIDDLLKRIEALESR